MSGIYSPQQYGSMAIYGGTAPNSAGRSGVNRLDVINLYSKAIAQRQAERDARESDQKRVATEKPLVKAKKKRDVEHTPVMPEVSPYYFGGLARMTMEYPNLSTESDNMTNYQNAIAEIKEQMKKSGAHSKKVRVQREIEMILLLAA